MCSELHLCPDTHRPLQGWAPRGSTGRGPCCGSLLRSTILLSFNLGFKAATEMLGGAEGWDQGKACSTKSHACMSFMSRFGLGLYFFSPYTESLWHHSSSPMTFTLPDP